VQQDQILKDGSSVRMTISRYYTPSGRSIQRPYSGDYSSYMQDEERYMKGELFFEDSIPIDKRLVYKTKQGRKVFGGGGIVPDVFIPLDTTGSSLVLTQLNMEQVFSAFVFKSLQQNRGQWKSINALVAYEIPSSEWNFFLSFCKQSYHIS
jgi:carboxyl-terminal processing protease